MMRRLAWLAALCLLALSPSSAQILGPWTHGAPVAGGGGGIVLVQHAVAETGSTLFATFPVSLTGTTAGNSFTVGSWSCFNSGCNTTIQTTTSVLTSVTYSGGTCSLIANANKTDPSGNAIVVAMAVCPNSSTGGSLTFTAHYSGGVNDVGADYPTLWVQEWSGMSATPDDGKGNGANGTGTAISVSTNTTLTQTNELVLSILGSSDLLAVSANQTLIECNADGGRGCMNYQIAGSTATQTNTGTNSGSTFWAAAIAALKHL